MTLISKIFSRKAADFKPNIQFGRYCDAFKSEEQLIHWDKAMILFSKEKYLECFEALLIFLKDPLFDNVSWKQANGKLQFTFLQGSKVIYGEVTALEIKVHAEIAGFKQKGIAWMRILLEENYNLSYCRFGINENDRISIYFDNYSEEALPQKTYEALRELAIRADKIDDILLSEFNELIALYNDHTIQLPENIVKAKLDFFKEKTHEVLKYIERPGPDILSFSSSYIYMILACIYKLDYLIKPEGTLMKNIENCHRSYFNNQTELMEIKTSNLISGFKEISNIKDSELKNELYDSRSTFGLDLPQGTQGLKEIIEAQWVDLEWFHSNRLTTTHRFICDYVVGFSLFSFALPNCYKELLLLYYRVTESRYFENLGYEQSLEKNDKINKKEVLKELQKLKILYKTEGNVFDPETGLLHFESIMDFCHSFLNMVRKSVSGI
jgi:hypothetical protein